MRIKLQPGQIKRAINEADRRQTTNEYKLRNGNRKGPTIGQKAIKAHRIGCMGEMAVAAFLGLEDYVFTESDPVPGSSDLPGNIDVKTRSQRWHDLIAPFSDSMDKKYVLVIYDGNYVEICGWIDRKDAAKKIWLKNIPGRGRQYVVPKEALNPLSTLKEYILQLEINDEGAN